MSAKDIESAVIFGLFVVGVLAAFVVISVKHRG